MLNFLWLFMILAGIVYAAFTGNLQAVTDAALDSAQQAVAICITMAGVLAFWVGLMQIAENAGMMRPGSGADLSVAAFPVSKSAKGSSGMQVPCSELYSKFFRSGMGSDTCRSAGNGRSG